MTSSWKLAIPNLRKLSAPLNRKESGSDVSSEGRKLIRDAVERERARLWDSQPPTKEAETKLGLDIQKQTGAPSVMVDRIVRRAATKRLQSKEGEGKKPN